ncbi:hypothetical protein Micbo1qcDRAFT_181176 [Microdochium bolleyi]|uniref:Uncharacterized protein n=1 Tax=Microdochium bolleyi TaxID=196109 RepID=A0A136IJ72_9PEZI|nr:hypothetical protein Micbo1qcDRAFT_181176 [Microdochium bolleyi]
MRDDDYDLILPDAMLSDDIGLTILESKVFRLLYSANFNENSDTALLGDICELEDELETWRMRQAILAIASARWSRTRQASSKRSTMQMHRTKITFEHHDRTDTMHGATS